MKRLFWFMLTFFIILVILCSCGRTQIVDEDGVEREIIDSHWIVIEDMGLYQHIVYDTTTKVVYFYDSYDGFLSPYQTQTEDGFICGAVFEDGVIKPAPYFTID